MDIAVLVVLIMLGSMIINRKKKGNTQSPHEPEERSEGMTWEEMERHYGLSMEPRDEAKAPAKTEPASAEPPTATVGRSSRPPAAPVLSPEAARYMAYVAARAERAVDEKLQAAAHSEPAVERRRRERSLLQGSAKNGMLWAIVLGPPAAKQRRYNRRSNYGMQ